MTRWIIPKWVCLCFETHREIVDHKGSTGHIFYFFKSDSKTSVTWWYISHCLEWMNKQMRAKSSDSRQWLFRMSSQTQTTIQCLFNYYSTFGFKVLKPCWTWICYCIHLNCVWLVVFAFVKPGYFVPKLIDILF